MSGTFGDGIADVLPVELIGVFLVSSLGVLALLLSIGD